MKIDPARQQLIGVQTAAAKKTALHNTVRAVGRVAHDPDLYRSLFEYDGALKALQKAEENPSEEVRERAQALVRATEIRLEHFGLTRNQMKELL